MARTGRMYYIIVNKATGRIDNNCEVCGIHNANAIHGLPSTDVSHIVVNISRANYGIMNEQDQATGNFINKWDNSQIKPVEDK